MLFVISAPSGAGKTTIIKELFKKIPDLRFSVSATTRRRRDYEIDTKDYYFISRSEFEDKIKRNEFVEWEEVHGNYYGTLRSEVENNLNKDYDIIFDVDVRGALSIKKLYPKSVTIFLDASKEDLISRLKNRKTETEEQIDKRIERMELELGLKEKFDYAVMNESNPSGFQKAVEQIINIIIKSKKEIK